MNAPLAQQTDWAWQAARAREVIGQIAARRAQRRADSVRRTLALIRETLDRRAA